jgi:hypothetical protein
LSQWFSSLDRLLRGEYTKKDELQGGRIAVPASRLVLAAIGLGGFYGACMGLYTAMGGREHTGWALLATAVKVPLLFLATLLVTFPSLYVFAALANSRLGMREMLRLFVAAIAVMLGVLASFGPITAFFTLSTDSHAFMVLLNVVFCTLAGIVGLAFLNRAINAVFPGAVAGNDASPEQRRAAAEESGRARRIVRVWLVIFGAVGAQMAWILRPFIGNPQLPFALFRPRWSNFFEFTLHALGDSWR